MRVRSACDRLKAKRQRHDFALGAGMELPERLDGGADQEKTHGNKISDCLADKTNPLEDEYEEFSEWADEDTRSEWVEGEVIIHMPPKNAHQNVVEFLYELLSLFVRLLNLGKVRIAPFEIDRFIAPTGHPLYCQGKSGSLDRRAAGRPGRFDH